VTGNDDAELADYERKLLSCIGEFGWQCTSVFDPDGEDPSFSYSVGFTSALGTPEFIIFGLNIELMHSMLSELFRQIKDGKSVVDGDSWSGILEGFNCIARAVHPTNVIRENANSAIWYWRHTGHEGMPPLYQLFWPGKADGFFPWDPDCSDYVRSLQPCLYLPAA
jgi:Domain of unknown function (DUF4262)